VAKLKYTEMRVTNYNYIQEKVKGTLNSWIAYYSSEYFLSRFLSKNLKTEICRTIIWPPD